MQELDALDRSTLCSELPPASGDSRSLTTIPGAGGGREELTSLGFHLAALPTDVRIGKLMLYGAMLGCIDPVLTIAAALSYRSPFIAPFDKRKVTWHSRVLPVCWHV
jgi:HrpA-like RNA helicase